MIGNHGAARRSPTGHPAAIPQARSAAHWLSSQAVRCSTQSAI
jgi:hypothetical protein